MLVLVDLDFLVLKLCYCVTFFGSDNTDIRMHTRWNGFPTNEVTRFYEAYLH